MYPFPTLSVFTIHTQIQLGPVQLLDSTAAVMPWTVRDFQRVLNVSVMWTVMRLATAVLTLRKPVLLVGHVLGDLLITFVQLL